MFKNASFVALRLLNKVTRSYRVTQNTLSSTKFKFSKLQYTNIFAFSTKLPPHEVLTMPALSPTMKVGKIVKWNKKVGDKVQQGDALCQVQTDKATVSFDLDTKGYIAKIINDGTTEIPIGQPVAIVVPTLQSVKQFQNYSGEAKKDIPTTPTQQPKVQSKKQQTKPAQTPSYPPHEKLTMPALSPTMKTGKIIKWNKKVGDAFSEGDSLCEVQTDKATVSYDTSEKGILAKILVGDNAELPVGALFAITVKNKDHVDKFKNYSLQSEKAVQSAPALKAASTPTETTKSQSKPEVSKQGRIFVSPIAKTIASEKGINLQQIQGSGPGGRILKQDVEGFVPGKKIEEVRKTEVPVQQTPTTPTTSAETQKTQKPAKKVATKSTAPENPFEEIQLSSMRKTIAARLTESKSTVPHYYISADINMDEILKVREEINKSQKQNGTKVSVNDIIIKACGLTLRDYPQVNSQWNTNTIRRFKYADVSMAVSTDSGLITPIIFRADTKGLLQISKNAKDLAKRAREGKLQPFEFIGGTCSVSNLGMFGINQMLAVINPPQSLIVGVGKTQKKIIFDQNSQDPNKPYKVSNIMNVTVSADHRVVDGALASIWIMRFKRYLQNPINLIL